MGISSGRHSYNADLYHQPSRRIEARIDANIPIFVSITILPFIEIINSLLFCVSKVHNRTKSGIGNMCIFDCRNI